MNIVLFDTPQAIKSLRPFSHTRALAKLRIGIATIEEKWQHYLGGDCSFLTAPYLSEKFPCVEASKNLCINSAFCPDEMLVTSIRQLKMNQKLMKDDTVVAVLCDQDILQNFRNNGFDHPRLERIDHEGALVQLSNKWDFFLNNEQELRKDFEQMRRGKTSQSIQDQYTITYNKQAIFLEKGASIKAAILNAEAGPIYIGNDVTIQEGTIIRGPVAICRGAQINAGARISNATTIGPYAKVGGEVSNSIIMGYSNKAHDGFMGNSVIGEWCNIGAGTNTSNLRSDYNSVKAWDEHREEAETTGLQFCGLFMGDHSKCGINTMFNAGAVVGVSTNLFGAGFVDKVVPSFTWGMPSVRMQTYYLDKAIEAAERMTWRRLVQLTAEDKKIFSHVFLATAIYRR